MNKTTAKIAVCKWYTDEHLIIKRNFFNWPGKKKV